MPAKIVNYRLQVRFQQGFTIPGTDPAVVIPCEAKTTTDAGEGTPEALERLKVLGEQIIAVIREASHQVTHAYIVSIDNGGNSRPVAWERAA